MCVCVGGGQRAHLPVENCVKTTKWLCEFRQWMSRDQMLVHAHGSARLDNMTCQMNVLSKLDFIQVSFDLNSGSFWR